MSATRFALDMIEVPIPCTVPWDSMRGTDTARHCDRCRKTVYRLSNMARKDAEELIRAHEPDGELCVQFFRRPDGTVVTRDCAAVRWWRAVVSAATVAAVSIWAFLGLRAFGGKNANSTFSFVGGGISLPPGFRGGTCDPPPSPGGLPALAPPPHPVPTGNASVPAPSPGSVRP